MDLNLEEIRGTKVPYNVILQKMRWDSKGWEKRRKLKMREL